VPFQVLQILTDLQDQVCFYCCINVFTGLGIFKQQLKSNGSLSISTCPFEISINCIIWLTIGIAGTDGQLYYSLRLWQIGILKETFVTSRFTSYAGICRGLYVPFTKPLKAAVRWFLCCQNLFINTGINERISLNH
jgi:hypothetical protein